MNGKQLPRISVIDPISPAIGKVKTILFKPFDLGKWFTIGFCAWLAQLGHGGFNFNFHLPYRHRQPSFDFDQSVQKAKDFIIDYLPVVVIVAVTVVVLVIVLWIILTWLSSRGRFMFLHCVAENKAEVKIPWTKFQEHANSLFLFRIVLGIITFFTASVFCLPIFYLGFIIVKEFNSGLNINALLGAAIISLIAAVFSIAIFLVHKFTTDFVVPIMFLRTAKCTVAWRQFLALLSSNKGKFTLYILFQIVIAMVFSLIILAAILITCCCAACIFIIPYIGTVLMLPLLIFHRAYSLCYFGQFGPELDVFGGEKGQI